MYERFRLGFMPLRDPVGLPASPWLDEQLTSVAGYTELVNEFCGSSFDGGLYRVHTSESGPQSQALVEEEFPEFAERVRCFSYDWLGRQFAVDHGQIDNGHPQVLLLEPGTGEALEIPVSIVDFHEIVLFEDLEAALAPAFFEAWQEQDVRQDQLKFEECVGYQVPLFLGGKDIVENLERIDLDTYWSVCGQLRSGTLEMQQGTTIRNVSIN